MHRQTTTFIVLLRTHLELGQMISHLSRVYKQLPGDSRHGIVTEACESTLDRNADGPEIMEKVTLLCVMVYQCLVQLLTLTLFIGRLTEEPYPSEC